MTAEQSCVDTEQTATRSAPAARAGLSIRGIGKSFAGNVVLSDVDLDVAPGEVVALLGENGAGKSTLSSVIAGVLAPSTGSMSWRGEPYAPSSPADALRAGVGLIHQEMRLLPDLSIAENVFVGRLPMAGGRVDFAEMNRRAGEQLRRLGLDVSPSTPVRKLSVAAQQQVEIAKALTLNARLIILDEPTAALGGEETDRLFEQVDRLRRDGVGFIYISHRLEEIARIADRVAVLRDGRKVAEHDTADAPVDTLVAEMVGRNVDRMFPTIEAPRDDAVTALAVTGLSAPDGTFSDINFSVRQGEVFGIAGIVGAGRTELVRGVLGADAVGGGTVEVHGQPLLDRSPGGAARAGLVMVPEDRKLQGLIQDQTIAENLSIGNFDLVAPGGWVTADGLRGFARRAIEQMDVKGAPGQRIDSLSGGNQQKSLIAKWVARNPYVLILDEPTRGIDVGARAGIYDTIAELARAGMAVVVVSSDLDEVLGLSHRVMVLSRGRNRGILDRNEATHVRVMELATT